MKRYKTIRIYPLERRRYDNEHSQKCIVYLAFVGLRKKNGIVCCGYYVNVNFLAE